MSRADIPAILLAAGASRRMGTPKALLELQGEALVVRLARTLQAGGARRVVVVTAPGEVGEAIRRRVDCVTGVQVCVNADPGRGMLSSVQAGIAAAGTPDALTVCPCDLPKLEPEAVRGVLSHMPGAGPAIVAPVFQGRRGHPTLFAGLTAEIMALDPEEHGLNVLLKRFAAAVVEVPVFGDGVLRDADTPEEWHRLVAETGPVIT